MKIFLSYRRADTADVCGRIYDHLENQYGPGSVYKDVESIRGGFDFRSEIQKAIEASDVVMCVIGRSWLGPRRSLLGRRTARIHQPVDFVRIELELANRFQKPLLPILVDQATLPKPSELPESIRFLTYQNAVQVRPDPDFRRDMQRVIAGADALALSVKNLEQLRQEQLEQEKLISLGRERLEELQQEEERRKQQQVLVVDDEDAIRVAIGMVIEDAGYGVITAADGVEALHILETTDQNLVVFIDLMMPRMGGLQVIEAVDANPALRNKHSFVLLAAAPPPNVVRQQVQLGFVILRKPFNLEDLERVVELEHTLADARNKLLNLQRP